MRILTYPRTCETLTALGIDPDTVVAGSATEDGYVSTVRHQDGTALPVAGDLLLYQVPWPSREAWLKVREALALDTVTTARVLAQIGETDA